MGSPLSTARGTSARLVGWIGLCAHVRRTVGTTACFDSDNGATDPYGDDCGDYAVYTYWCGDGTYDDDDFSHDEMCCACGGGSGGGFCVDHLTVNDVQYCDEHGPQGVAVTDSTSITFISDYNNGGHAGFSICLASSFTGIARAHAAPFRRGGAFRDTEADS